MSWDKGEVKLTVLTRTNNARSGSVDVGDINTNGEPHV